MKDKWILSLPLQLKPTITLHQTYEHVLVNLSTQKQWDIFAYFLYSIPLETADPLYIDILFYFIPPKEVFYSLENPFISVSLIIM